MTVEAHEILLIGVGFVLIVFLLPIRLTLTPESVTSSWNPVVITAFRVFIPVLYIIGSALYMLGRLGKKE